MAKPMKLDHLTRALHNAVIEAQKLTEQQHLRQLHRYFYHQDEGQEPGPESSTDGNQPGMPKRLKIMVPNMDPGAEESWRDLEVPQLALVPPGSIQIKEMKVGFNVMLHDLEHDDPRADGFAIPGEDPKHRGSIIVDIGSIANPNDPNIAKVEVAFIGTDAPEALHRIIDTLAKVITP